MSILYSTFPYRKFYPHNTVQQHCVLCNPVYEAFLLFLVLSILLCFPINAEDTERELSLESYLKDLSQTDYTLKDKLTRRIKEEIMTNPASIEKYSSSSNFLVKVCFIRAVAERNTLSDYEFLLHFLGDPDEEIVIEALKALGSSKNAQFEKLLRDKCDINKNEEAIVCTALLALGELEHEDSSTFIHFIYTSTHSYSIRYSALIALGKIRTSSSVEKLTALYPSAPENLKNLILELLGKCRSVPVAIDFLDGLLKTIADTKKQALILCSLGQLESEKHYDVFIEYIQSDDKTLFHAAIKALEHLGNGNAIYPLFKALSKRFEVENQERIYSAIETICALYSLEEIQHYLHLLDHPSRIITQLTDLGAPSSETILRELIAHDDPINRIFAIHALAKSTPVDTAKKLLIQHLPKASPIDIAHILPLFIRWRKESLISYTDLNGIDPASRNEPFIICNALFRQSDSLHQLTDIIRNERSHFRWCAVYALIGQQSTDENIHLIIDRLKNGFLIQRFYAARTLALLANEHTRLQPILQSFHETETNEKVKAELKKGIW